MKIALILIGVGKPAVCNILFNHPCMVWVDARPCLYHAWAVIWNINIRNVHSSPVKLFEIKMTHPMVPDSNVLHSAQWQSANFVRCIDRSPRLPSRPKNWRRGTSPHQSNKLAHSRSHLNLPGLFYSIWKISRLSVKLIKLKTEFMKKGRQIQTWLIVRQSGGGAWISKGGKKEEKWHVPGDGASTQR